MKQEGRSIPSVAGPISKAFPRGNVSLDGSFWHKDTQVNMKSPGSQSLGRGESGQRTEPGGGEGRFRCKRLAKGEPSGEEVKGGSWEDVRKAGDSYTPAYTLNLTSTIQMRKNTVDRQEQNKDEF